ncbi:glycine--tRNA ligase [Candidatus Bathyarchaeota archaeon]|nr:glycine--tRNA ligase [Candidatus Bathyarchaeota archaeon]
MLNRDGVEVLMQSLDKFEIISELARRRGFFWPASEIYGGISGFIVFGPLGSVLKRRIEDKLRDRFIRRLGFFEIESPVIMLGKVFEASGHVNNFREPMVTCKGCKRNFRADHLLQEFARMSSTETEKLSLQELMDQIDKKGIQCPECGGTFYNPQQFLTMFSTTLGPYSEEIGYGRPEAAQGIFVEFKRLYECVRGRLPFAVAQIGHALRNEISPRQGPIRLREFTIMDLELFFDPEEPHCSMLKEVEKEVLRLIPAEIRLRGEEKPIMVTADEALNKGYIKTEWQAFFMALSKRFLVELGIPEDKQRFIEKLDWEKAHYSAQGFDQEIYLERWGWVEISGHNYRTNYDLKCHMEASGIDLRVFKRAKTKEKSGRFFPHVVEPSFGSDRLVYATLEYAHKTKEGRTLLSLPRDVAPIQLNIFPLVSKEGLPEKAKQLHQKLINEGFMVEYDESGSIGRRYARADEVGIPLGITIDYQTLEDDTVTLRDRDTWRQVRNKIEKLSELLHVYFDYKIEFKDLGHPIEK